MTATVSFGHAVAQAQEALTAALARVLADAGATPGEWFALNTIAVLGGEAAAVRNELQRAPGATAAGVDATLGRLTSAGFVVASDDGTLSLTHDGAARHVALRDMTRALTGAMTDGLDPAALATTTDVLRTVTERANARRQTGR